MANKQYMLTTVDNPFNPFTHFDEWYSFDMEKGYDCCGRLDRLLKITDEMTDIEVNAETERAIDRIVELDFLDLFTKVSSDLIFPDDQEE